MKMSTKEYDMIPDHVLGRELLEIGGGSGKRQLASNKKDYFLGANWVNVDLKPGCYPGSFTFVHGDIMDIDPARWRRKFDTVLIVECLEHVEIRKWLSFFEKIKSWLKPGGWIVLTVPYNENMNKIIRLYRENEHDHRTFRITSKTFNNFLPGAGTKIFCKWGIRDDGEGIIRPVLRYFKRIFTSSYFVNYWLPMRPKLLVTWQKPG